MKARLTHGFNRFKALSLKRQAMIIVVVAGLAIAVGVIAVNQKPIAKPVAKKSTEPVITYSSSNPDESKANADKYNWQGTADEPKRLIIVKIGLNSLIQKMGVDQNKQIAVPTNVHLAGWFSETVKPGQKGLAVIDGHVHGKIDVGVFLKLKDLSKGDEFVIERGDGQKLTYKVTANTTVAEAKSASVVFSADPGNKTGQVNLVTCGGKYDRAKGEYPDRVIVAGALVGQPTN